MNIDIRVIQFGMTNYMIPVIQREGAEGALVSEFLPVVQLVPFKSFLSNSAVITMRALEEHFP